MESYFRYYSAGIPVTALELEHAALCISITEYTARPYQAD